MITRSAAWKNALAEAVRDPAELLALLDLPVELLHGARAASELFPLRVPRGFVARMEKGNPDDPLLQQVLALGEELVVSPGFNADPVGDLPSAARPGLLHKYHGRVLLIVTGACAVHCRYCFRRHFPYTRENPSTDGWREALEYIAGNPGVEEVILSGGDPLVLDDERLKRLVDGLNDIPHLRRLRVHTRLPIVLPERVDGALLEWFCGGRLQPVMVIHSNHPRELDGSVAEALERLRRGGARLLNQAVLLKGVNDSADTLCSLSESLFDLGVMPYYLHLLDRVQGAAHFEVPAERAMALMEEVRSRLSGFLVPQLVREAAGAPYKLPMFSLKTDP